MRRLASTFSTVGIAAILAVAPTISHAERSIGTIDIPQPSVIVLPQYTELQPDQSVQLVARIVSDQDGFDAVDSPFDAPAIWWTTSDPEVAEVDGRGLVTAGNRPGGAEIIAYLYVKGWYYWGAAKVEVVPADSDEVPTIEVVPHAIKLTEPGDFEHLRAYVGGRETQNVTWRSSNPKEIAIETDVNGRTIARSLVEVGSSMITAELRQDVEHYPGMVVATALRQVKGVTDVEDHYLYDVSFPSAGLDPGAPIAEAIDDPLVVPVTMKLDEAYYERHPQIKAGDVLTNAQRGSIKVASVALDDGLITLTGTLPELTELYSELDIDISEDEVAQWLRMSEDASGRPARLHHDDSEKPQKRSAAGCEFRVDVDLIGDVDFRFKISNRKLMLFSLVSTLTADALIQPLNFKSSYKCKYKPFDPYAIMGISLAGWATLVPQLYVEFFVQGHVSGNFDDHTFLGPSFLTRSGGRASLVYEDQQASSQLSADPPSFDSNLNIIDDYLDDGLTIGFQLGVDAGAVTGIIGGPWPVRPWSTGPIPGTDIKWSEMTLVDIKAPVFRAGAGRNVSVPFGALLPESSSLYRGIDGTDFIAATLYPIREVAFGGLIRRIFDLVGDGPPWSIRNLAGELPLGGVVNKWPVITDFRSSDKKVYVGGFEPGHPLYAEYPGSVELSSDVSRWMPQLVPAWADPWNQIKLWRRPAGSDDAYAPFMTNIRTTDVTYTPTAQDLGMHELRAHLYYFRFLAGSQAPFKPAVSQPLVLEVADLPTLVATPRALSRSLVPGASELVPIEVVSLAVAEVEYHFETSLSWVDVPAGSFELTGQSTAQHDFEFSCPDEVGSWTGVVELVNDTDDESLAIDLRLDCRLLEVRPAFDRLKAPVGQFVTRDFAIENLTDQDLDILFNLDGFSGSGAYTIPAGATINVPTSSGCAAAGETEHGMLAYVSGYDHRGEIIKVCSEPGHSHGDPHLYSFDRTKFDFQGRGEFLLSSWPGHEDEFEVQSRQVPWGSRDVTVNQALAFAVHGDRVNIYEGPQIPPQGGPLMVNGEVVELARGDRMTLPSSTSTLSRLADDRLRLLWADGARATITQASRHLNLELAPPSNAGDELVGVFGNLNGVRNDDFKLRDGTVLASPPSFAELYDCVGGPCFAYDATRGWLIRTHEDSMFQYEAGEGPMNFAPSPDAPFPAIEHRLEDFPQDALDWAESVCRAAGVESPELLASCMLDLVLTNDPAFAESIASMQMDTPPESGGGLASSCKQLKAAGHDQSGPYEIDADGPGPRAPVTVYCDMTTGDGGWTFYWLQDGPVTASVDDADGCGAVGLQLFAPRSRADFELARDYLLSIGAEHFMGPLGLYNDRGGEAAVAVGKAMNSYDVDNAAALGWRTTLVDPQNPSEPGDWWISDRTDLSEPNGDYTARCWLEVLYDEFGDVRHYNDWDENSCRYSYSDYLCMHADNTTLSHTAARRK